MYYNIRIQQNLYVNNFLRHNQRQSMWIIFFVLPTIFIYKFPRILFIFRLFCYLIQNLFILICDHFISVKSNFAYWYQWVIIIKNPWPQCDYIKWTAPTLSFSLYVNTACSYVFFVSTGNWNHINNINGTLLLDHIHRKKLLCWNTKPNIHFVSTSINPTYISR